MLISSIMELGFFLTDVTSALAPSTVRGLLAICGRRDVDRHSKSEDFMQEACCTLSSDPFFPSFSRSVEQLWSLVMGLFFISWPLVSVTQNSALQPPSGVAFSASICLHVWSLPCQVPYICCRGVLMWVVLSHVMGRGWGNGLHLKMCLLLKFIWMGNLQGWWC